MKEGKPIKTNIYQHRQKHTHIYIEIVTYNTKEHEKVRATLTPLHRNTDAFECTFRHIRTQSQTQIQAFTSSPQISDQLPAITLTQTKTKYEST